jgi:hypothetical protein
MAVDWKPDCWRLMVGFFLRSTIMGKRTLVTALLLLAAVAGSTVALLSLSRTGTRDCEAAALPLIRAIERYRQLHGRYPEALELLIAQRLIPSMPEPPSSAWVMRDGFDYFKDDELDFFCLSYNEKDRFGGLGPARVWTRGYVSFENAWFREGLAPGDFPHALGLAMTRAGRRYSASRSSEDLDLLVNKMIRYSGYNTSFQTWISKHDLVAALRGGTACNIPEHPGIVFRSEGAHPVSYCFVANHSDYPSITAVYRRDDSTCPQRWEMVFRDK